MAQQIAGVALVHGIGANVMQVRRLGCRGDLLRIAVSIGSGGGRCRWSVGAPCNTMCGGVLQGAEERVASTARWLPWPFTRHHLLAGPSGQGMTFQILNAAATDAQGRMSKLRDM